MVNIVAVIMAGIVGYALGAIWYGPLFGKEWMKLAKVTKKDMKKAKDKTGWMYLGGFLTALVTSYVLAHFISLLGIVDIGTGIQVGIWAWLGFIATVSLGGVLWRKDSMHLWVLNNAYNMIQLAIMAAIIVAWP